MKKVLMVQNLDGTKEAICPSCKGIMAWRDLGEAMGMVAGNLCQRDFGGFWECTNTKCCEKSHE